MFAYMTTFEEACGRGQTFYTEIEAYLLEDDNTRPEELTGCMLTDLTEGTRGGGAKLTFLMRL